MKGLRFALLALLALLLTACVALPETETVEPAEPGAPAPPVKPDIPRPASDVDELLGYFQHLKKLPGNQLGKEHDNARQAFVKEASEINRVRLAMVLSMPSTPFADDARALDLLDPVIRSRQTSMYGLAFLLATYIQERRKLEGNVQSLQQNLQGLQQKLDALKSLERSLIEREQGGARKR